MKLYYIGNGFDLAHNLPTRYLDFKEYFKTNYPEYYYRFIEMYGLGEIHSDYNGPYYDDSESEEIIELWMDFENTLSKIDSSFIYNKLGTIQETRDLTKSEFEGIFDPDPAWYNDVYVENMNLYELYKPLQKAFISWIESIEKNIFPTKPDKQPKPFYPIPNNNSFFVVFNYTHTLQKMYNIDNSHIFYPHGEAGNPKEYPKFGHGDSSASEQIEALETYDDDSHYIIDWISQYVSETQKNVEDYLWDTSNFLENIEINDDEEIIINVLGCSFSNIDVPYFIKVTEIFPDAEWNISYYSDEDKKRIKDFIKKYNFKTLTSNIVQCLNNFIVILLSPDKKRAKKRRKFNVSWLLCIIQTPLRVCYLS